MSTVEAYTNEVLREVVDAVLRSQQPVVVNPALGYAGLTVIGRKAWHLHATDGRCLKRLGEPTCVDEFDWWRDARP